MNKPKRKKKDAFGRAVDSAIRAMKRDHGSIGMFAHYPTKETPPGQEVAIVIAFGEHAKRVGRWLRRSR